MPITLTDRRTRIPSKAIRAGLAKPGHGASAILTQLRRAIETGAYSEGDQLPPERQLAATFQAARSTVRRALDQLERAGLVSRRLGSGTFVSTPARPIRLAATSPTGSAPCS